MAKDFSTLENSNRSGNSNIHDLSDPSRRMVLRGGAAGAVGALLAPLAGIGLPGCASLDGGPTLRVQERAGVRRRCAHRARGLLRHR